ncbi:MAG TPA: lipopolysaccharide heptosyltransferase I [Thermoanaerobaculia bacterium]|nr:lipopolysaccharide heptosyltransferase I [Thermoanaerobaculia bacterium]
MSGPRSILILRTSALGDVVHCLPVASALRRAFPTARIAWVVEEPFLPLVASHPAVDEAIPVKLRRWRRTPFAAHTRREVFAFVRRLRALRPDVALELMGNHKGGILAWLSRAPQRIGAIRAARREPSSALWLNRLVVPLGEHAVDRALSLVSALGITPEPADFASPALLPAPSNDVPGEPAGYVLLQPGAGWGNKRYPLAWWGAVARTLAAAGERVRVLAGPGEMPLAAEVVAASGNAAEPLDPCDLTALAAWLRGARLVLGGDTGPLHLAHALGVPVLALHGPTDPARHGPYGAPERALFRRLPCSFCYRRFAETKACLLELAPAEVAARALALLDVR